MTTVASMGISEVRPNFAQKDDRYHSYELDQSESITFLYGLLYDENSALSKSDILTVLTSLKDREETLPFSYGASRAHDIQGVRWPRGLRSRFMDERQRVSSTGWFRNIPGSLDQALNQQTVTSATHLADFFRFQKFVSKLKLHITHFQLRNLVCCSTTSKGVYYPSNYYHTSSGYSEDPLTSLEHDAFFKINRLAYDNVDADTMKLDCIIDSKHLVHNPNSRVSTMSCSNRFLVTGTFEGGYILTDVSDTDQFRHLGEYQLTPSMDGITNNIIISDNKELIVSSNDKSIRQVDLDRNIITSVHKMDYSANCLALNPSNCHELLVCGDTTHLYIHDTRAPGGNTAAFKGQQDFSFSCDWSPADANLLLAGNQDGCVRLWDRRAGELPLHCFSGSLGSSVRQNGTVRNTKFSNNGQYICWAESLDHVGLLKVEDLNSSEVIEAVQSIEFIGKCTGLSFCETDMGYGEQLIIGVYDSPLGGILSYNLPSSRKTLDFDFVL